MPFGTAVENYNSLQLCEVEGHTPLQREIMDETPWLFLRLESLKNNSVSISLTNPEHTTFIVHLY